MMNFCFFFFTLYQYKAEFITVVKEASPVTKRRKTELMFQRAKKRKLPFLLNPCENESRKQNKSSQESEPLQLVIAFIVSFGGDNCTKFVQNAALQGKK